MSFVFNVINEIGEIMENKNILLDKKITRRDFLEYLIGGSLFVTFLSVGEIILSYLWPRVKSAGMSEKIEIGSESDIPIGKGKVVPFRDKSAIVINTKTGFVAFSAICTHLGCIVKWDESKQQMFCPCHAGFFDTKGNVVSGPPPKSLPPYKVQVIGGKIYLSE